MSYGHDSAIISYNDTEPIDLYKQFLVIRS